MLIYPPGEIYQRGEDRCQINVKASVANSLRACNDLGYAAAILKNEGYEVFLKDYSAVHYNYSDFEADFKRLMPDVVFISITNPSIFEDINFAKKIKTIKSDVVIVFKGALFFNPDDDLFEELDLSALDYLIGGEVEFVISKLLNAHYNDQSKLKTLEGICYKLNGKWVSNKVTKFEDKLDEIPFPDRSLMENNLYINPATNRPMATISTSKGCPSSCIYCVSPVISGRKVRFRSAESVFDEISECVQKFGIYDFFFKSDTFTIKKDWVMALCDYIIKSGMHKKINWVANSRVNTVDEEMLNKMKEAGCSVIAFGFESGSDDSLKQMKKGTTVEQNIKAAAMAKKAGLKIFGYYLIGFPWETREHLNATKDLIFKLDTDFMEISITTPYKGSELYNMLFSGTEKNDIVLGKDSYKNSTMGTNFLSQEDLSKFRKDVIFKYHIRPSFIFKKIFSENLTPGVFFNYVKYGLRLIKNTLF